MSYTDTESYRDEFYAAAIICGLILLAIVAYWIFAGSSGSMPEDEFRRIRTGMSYAEVVQIVGDEGKLTTSVGGPFAMEMYEWSTEAGPLSSTSVSFMNGRVVTKVQVNL